MMRSVLLMNWVKSLYKQKRIRVSGEPYMDHLIFVAELAEKYEPLGYEIGLCHDLLEDLPLNAGQLHHVLANFGYKPGEQEQIVKAVVELTEVFTKTRYPELSKKQRRKLETKRLAKTGKQAQTVKYADLIYNIGWTVKYEREKAEKYLRRKNKLLQMLDKGDSHLHKKVLIAARRARSTVKS
ncbi:hypothetical protein [Mucilaginibacter endophyticus]|uniref:hypothetical protein n=1 Tax=Mucilaginibacter endophyticus TaxID=2675003 RepID=UPI001379E358|nr:hypothetical protein [Mucilaginibacter endophyticus]